MPALKYQYFRTAKLNFDDAFAVNGINYHEHGARATTRPHNVLASLVYNFNGREAAEPARRLRRRRLRRHRRRQRRPARTDR